MDRISPHSTILAKRLRTTWKKSLYHGLKSSKNEKIKKQIKHRGVLFNHRFYINITYMSIEGKDITKFYATSMLKVLTLSNNRIRGGYVSDLAFFRFFDRPLGFI